MLDFVLVQSYFFLGYYPVIRPWHGKRICIKMSGKQEIIDKVFWDYRITPEQVDAARTGKGWDTGEFILRRLFDRLDWYELIDLLGMERIKACLTPEFIQTLRTIDLREKYEYIRNILQGQAVSVPGWSDANRRRRRHSLLSDRWYRSKSV